LFFILRRFFTYASVYQTVVREPPVALGGSPGWPQAVLEGKVLQKLY
jgi:hypothetical protein